MKRFLSAFLILLLIAACGTKNASNVPTSDLPALLPPSPEPNSPSSTKAEVIEETPSISACVATEPTTEDIERALSFTGKLFDTEDWARTYTVSADRVSVFWNSTSLAGVVFLELLIFPCSYEDLDLDNYFSLDNWQIVFEGYDSYEYLTECRSDSGLRLYQFSTSLSGYEYDVKYWAVNDTEHRVVTLEIILPVELSDYMDEYSYSLFPQFTDC